MPPRSRISIAKPDIVQTFEQCIQRIYTHNDLEHILSDNRSFWRLTQSLTTNSFIQFLLENTKLKLQQIKLPNRPTNRYTWGDVPTLEIIQTLRPEGYFTHFSAMQLHGLTGQVPKTIYFNFEQRATGGGGQLNQESINRAFKRKCRVSQNIAIFHERNVCVLNGQNTGKLGVADLVLSDGSILKVTNIERTLIDAAVRPIYSGGVFEVAKAYAAAHSQFSVNKLVSYLQKLNYTYPYHQAIGYYLERSCKYSKTQIELLRQADRSYDFYLAHEMNETEYVKRWKLFVPKGF